MGTAVDRLVDEWQQQWAPMLQAITDRTGCTRLEALQYVTSRELAVIRMALEERGANGMRYHPDCKACQQEKHFHELQLETMEQGLKHMREEHDDGWKDV